MIALLSTGHKELDDILSKNGIIDQEDQQKEEIQKCIEHFKTEFKSENTKSNETDCLIERFRLAEIARGVPVHLRTRGLLISCKCKKCNPFTM